MTVTANRLYCLLKLTWEGCGSGIRTVIATWMGMVIFITGAVAFLYLNVLYNAIPYFTTIPPTITMSPDLALLLFVLLLSVINTVSLLTFLAIVICLFTFATEFAYICYYFDDCTWAIPNAIIRNFKWIHRTLVHIAENAARSYMLWDQELLDAHKKYYQDKQLNLIARIKDIKKSDWL